MQADEALVSYIATTYYEMSPVLGSIKRLPGYDDRNFLLTDSKDHKTCVLKIVNRDESLRELTDIIDEVLSGAYERCQAESGATQGGHFVVPKLIRTSGDKMSTYTTVRYRRTATTTTTTTSTRADNSVADDKDSGDFEEVKCNIRMCEFFDGVTMSDYIQTKRLASTAMVRSNGLQELERLYFRLGKMCNQLFVYLRTQVHLVEKLKAIRAQFPHPWALYTCEKFIPANLNHLFPLDDHGTSEQVHPKRRLVERTLDEYLAKTRPVLDSLPEFILHSDLSNGNILVGRQHLHGQRETLPDSLAERLCLIDFQDLQVGAQVTELSIMMLYNILDQQQMPLERALVLVPRWIYLGYQSSTSCPLDPNEMSLTPSIMKLRLCQSLLNGLIAIEREPDNSYVMQTNQRGWQLLELMSDENETLGKPEELARLWLTATGVHGVQ